MDNNVEVLEGNKLIAEFMQHRHFDTIRDNEVRYWVPNQNSISDSRYDSQLKHHLSWDWLMPVVEKIQSIDITPAPTYTGYRIEIVVQGYVMIKGFLMPTINTNVSVEGSLIAAVWKAVVQFIKWYNTQSK